MVNVTVLLAWLKRPFASPIAAYISNWATIFTVLGGISWTGLMAWAASSIGVIAEQGWGAVLFAAIGVTFVLALMARALLPILVYFRPPRGQPVSSSGTTPKESGMLPVSHSIMEDHAGRIHKIEIALLNIIHIEGMRISKEILSRWIKEAPHIPKMNERKDFDIEVLRQELSEFREYSRNVENQLLQMIFRTDCRNIMMDAEASADAEIRDMGNSPNNLPPYEFREWFIARSKARKILDFMKRKRSELDDEMMYYLSKLEEQQRNIQAKDRRG